MINSRIQSNGYIGLIKIPSTQPVDSGPLGFPHGFVQHRRVVVWGLDSSNRQLDLQKGPDNVVNLAKNLVIVYFPFTKDFSGDNLTDEPLISEDGTPMSFTDEEWGAVTRYCVAVFVSEDGNYPTGIGDHIGETSLNPCEFPEGFSNGSWSVKKMGRIKYGVNRPELIDVLTENKTLFFWVGIGNDNTETNIPIG